MNEFAEAKAPGAATRPAGKTLNISLKVPEGADVGEIIKAASELGEELVSISLGPDYGYPY